MKKNLCSGLVLRLVSFAASTAIAVGFVTPPLASYAAAPLFAQGSGTKADPYLITSQQELSNIRKTDGLFFRLEKDLTLYQWEPIGTADDPLVGGGFDGNGYKISSMKAGGADYAGLFGYTQRLSVINLGVDTASVSANTAGGGIVGRASGGSIKNCYVTGEIKGDKYAGGIVGVADDTVIQGCYTNTALSGPGYKGGISGTGGNVSDCYFSTDLIGQSVGQLSPTQLKNAFDSSAGGTPTSVMQSGNFPLKLSTSKLASATEWNTLEEGAFPTQVTNRTRVLPTYEANTSAVSPLAASAQISFEPNPSFKKYANPLKEDDFITNKIYTLSNAAGDKVDASNYLTGQTTYTLLRPDSALMLVGITDDNLACDANGIELKDTLGNYIYVNNSSPPKELKDIDYPYWEQTYIVVTPRTDSTITWKADYKYTFTPVNGDGTTGTPTTKDGSVTADETITLAENVIIPKVGKYYNPQAENVFAVKNQKVIIDNVYNNKVNYAQDINFKIYSTNDQIPLDLSSFDIYRYYSAGRFEEIDPLSPLIVIDRIDPIGPIDTGVANDTPKSGYQISFNISNDKSLMFTSPGEYEFILIHSNSKNANILDRERLTDGSSDFRFTVHTKKTPGGKLTATATLNSIDLSWFASTNPGVSEYYIYIQEGDKKAGMDSREELEPLKEHSSITGISTTIKSLILGDTTTLKPGTDYTVAVAAMSAGKITTIYGPELVTTKSIPALVKSNVTSTSVNLTWPKQDETSNWTYMLYMSSSDITKPDAKFDGAASQLATGTQWSWSKLEPGKKYYFNVKATNNITGQEVTYQGVEVTTLVQGQLSAPVITTNVSNPKALPAGGKATITMKHDNTSECSIYYTLDGTTPNINSTKYSAPFEITSKNLNGETISISAICLQDGLTPSTITKLDLTFGKSSLLPIDGKVLDIYDHAWSEIVAALESSTTGSVEIMLDENTTTIPKSFFAAIAGKDMTVILNMGSYYWTLKGKDVKTARDSIDMGLVYGNDLSLVSNRYLSKLDEVDYIDLYQMSLNHDGGFPFDAKLTLNLGKGNSGSFGNMYYVNENRKKLDYMESATIGKTGNASYDFSHASSYVIVVSEEQMANIGSGAFIEDIIVPIQKLPPVIPICAGALGVGIVMMIIVRKITKD